MHELELAEWRRLIARRYTDVRALALADPVAAHELWRSVREELYREHPQSPVPAGLRAEFRAQHFPYDEAWRFTCAVSRAPLAPSGFALPNSVLALRTGPAFRLAGIVEIPFRAGTRTLSVFWLDEYSGGLFLPFGDLTNGQSTYAAGRYLLDTAKGADLGGGVATDTLTLDFNFAYQPSCAFDARWACPLAPPSNRLDIDVPAGERLA